MRKALGLLSGGLDSMLAVRVLKEQGIDVTAISFVTPFFSSKRAERAAREMKVPIIIKNITVKHLKMLLKPKHGYGSNMNPCIDCHALMLNIAGKIMEEKKIDFLFTGEVLGERPMSQNKTSLQIVAKESGYEDFVLRPLSAKLLPETKPEREGKVDRSRLLDLSGRQRKRQFELAKKYQLKSIPTPASGCLLTDPGFSNRLRDLFATKRNPTPEDVELLKTGRHIRLDIDNKIIVGRNEADNKILAEIKNDEYKLFFPKEVRGPHCMVPKRLKGKLFCKALDICASYCSASESDDIMFVATEEKEAIKTSFSKANRPKKFIGS